MNLHDFDIKKEAFENGKQAGAQQKAVEAAKSFYANGVSVDIIAKSLNITMEEVSKIIEATH